jgi:predicted aspartyl protease
MIRAATQRLLRPGCLVIISALGLGTLCNSADAECTVAKIAELKVTMNGMRPVVTAQINGADGSFIVDSGSFYNIISAAGAAHYSLRAAPAPNWLIEGNADSRARPMVVMIDDLMVSGYPVKHMDFLVGGNGGGSGILGVLGLSILQNYDVEYDLGNGFIRLLRADHCAKTGLVYWAKSDQTHSEMDIQAVTSAEPFTVGTAMLNGSQIRVLFDSGANASRISPQAARAAGLKTDPADLIDAGYAAGIGRVAVRTHIAPFASFKVGDEEIRNLRLRIGDTGNGTDMLLGADFFLSHRIYVANSQQKLYFTYNGGPVFSASR